MDFITCIICPNSCELNATSSDGEVKVIGARCKKGVEYGKEEFVSPKRLFTSTISVGEGSIPLIPVRTELPIPKALMFKAMEEIKKMNLKAPIFCGDVLISNFMGLGIKLIATGDVPLAK